MSASAFWPIRELLWPVCTNRIARSGAATVVLDFSCLSGWDEIPWETEVLYLETEVLNQVVTIWLGWINLLFYNVCNTTSQIVTMVHVEAACQVWHVAKAIFASFQPFFPSSSIILIFGIGLMYPQDCQILVDDFRHPKFCNLGLSGLSYGHFHEKKEVICSFTKQINDFSNIFH